MIDSRLLEILACPACDERPSVRLDGDKLVCSKCGRLFSMRDGIPIMLLEEAEPGGEK